MKKPVSPELLASVVSFVGSKLHGVTAKEFEAHMILSRTPARNLMVAVADTGAIVRVEHESRVRWALTQNADDCLRHLKQKGRKIQMTWAEYNAKRAADAAVRRGCPPQLSEDDDRPMVHRVIPAATASPLRPRGPASVFDLG